MTAHLRRLTTAISMDYRRYTRAELEALPVLSVGQSDDLDIEDRTRSMPA